jgi:hypothetical protein
MFIESEFEGPQDLVWLVLIYRLVSDFQTLTSPPAELVILWGEIHL